MTAAPAIARGARWLGPALAVVGVAAVFGAVLALIVLSQTLSGEDEPPAVGPFSGVPGSGITGLDVKQRDGGKVIVSLNAGANDRTGGSAELQLAPGAKVDVLKAIDSTDVKVGDQVTVIGIANEVKNFSIHSVVVQSGEAPADGQALRTPAGFFGFEASRVPQDSVVLAGTVTAAEGNQFTLHSAAGDVALTLDHARLYRVQAGSLDDVQEGDRVAGAFSSGQPLPALLVWPGGARQESAPQPGAGDAGSQGGGGGQGGG